MLDTLVWKILLVDDDEDDYLLTREMLAMAQGKEIQLKWAASFNAGCQALDADAYDAVLIDYDLGEHTGLELIRMAVAQGYPSPLMLITGRGGYEVDLEAMQAGATLYLTKSELNPPLLDRSIRYAIERKQAEVALGEARQELERRVQERTQELARANLELETARLTLESTVARRTNELRRANEKLADQMEELETALAERQEKEERIDRLTRLYVTLSRVNEAIVRTRDAHELYSRVCEIVADGGDFPLVWIGEVQGVQVAPVAACGPATGYLKEIKIETQGVLSQGPSGRSLREDRPVVNDDFATNPTTSPWRDAALRHGIHSSASFPLHRRGRPIGTFVLYSSQPGTFDPELVALLEQLSDDVSYALDALDQEQLRLRAEQALRTNEERYRSLFNDMTEGFALHEIMLDEQGQPVDYRFLEVNPAFERLTGLKRENVIGKTHSQLLPDDDPRWVEIYGHVALDGEPVHFENYSPALKKHYEVYAYCPAPMQFAVLFMNVTERKQMDEALRRSETRLRRFYESGLLGVIYWNMDGEITDANDKFLAMTGYTRQEMEAGLIDWARMTPPEYQPLDERSMVELKATGVNAAPFEKEYIRKDGTRFPVLIAGAMLDEPRNNGIAFVLDITSRKQAEAALGESERRYRDLFNSMEEGFCIIEVLFDAANKPLDYRFLEVNAAFEKQAGLHDVQGKLIRSLTPALEEYWFEIFGKIALTGEPAHFENEARALNRIYDVYAYRVGRPEDRQVAIIFTDISERRQTENALRQSEQHYRALFEGMQEGFYLVSIRRAGDGQPVDMEYLDCNPAFERIMGRPRGEIIGHTGKELVPSLRQEWLDVFSRVEQTGEPTHHTGYSDAFQKHFETFVFRPAEGQVAVVVNDVSGRMQAEQALREAHERVEWVARFPEENPNPVVRVDLNGRILYRNPTAGRLPGWKRGVGQLADGALLLLIQRALALGHEIEDDVRLDGGYYAISAVPLPDEGYVNIYGRDVARRRQVELALREGEQRWATTLASIGDAVVTTDRQGRVTYFNPVAEKLSGWSIQEAAGLPMEQVFPLVNEDTLRPAENPVEKVLRDGRVAGLSNHTALITRHGQSIPIEDSAAPIQDSAGQTLGVVMVFHDVTEKRKKEAALREADALMRDYAQKLERSNRELQDFAAIASHDLQEPLRKIRAFSDLLQTRLEGRLDEQELDLLKRMLSATGRMHELIDSLLTLSRVTTKAQPFKTVDMREVAEEVVAGFEAQIERCGGRVELGELPKVQADPVQMRQLLQNLVGNALKFHRPGVPPQVQISGGTPAVPASGDSGVAEASRASGAIPGACIEVSDNGIGFEMKYLERIFRPFERLHGRGEFEGAGMGLAICKKIVERHQGTINARSVVGEGSTFIVTLPVRQE